MSVRKNYIALSLSMVVISAAMLIYSKMNQPLISEMANRKRMIETKYESIVAQKGKRILIQGIPTDSKTPRYLILSDGEVEWEDPAPGQHTRQLRTPITIEADVNFIEPSPMIGSTISAEGVTLPIPQQVERKEGYYLLQNCKIIENE